MTQEELITYYTSVTKIDGKWRAHCCIEGYSMDGDYVEELGTIDTFSIYSSSDALKTMADAIEVWEANNIGAKK